MTLVFIKLLPFRLELTSNGDMNELENHSMGSVSPRSPLHSHSRSASDDLKEKLINDNDKTQNIVINEIVIDKDEDIQSSSISYTLLIKLCLLGFFVNFQPSESYLSSYLEDTKNFTDSQIDNHIWPYDTYGALISLLPIGIAAEHFGFRKIIFFWFNLSRRNEINLIIWYRII